MKKKHLYNENKSNSVQMKRNSRFCSDFLFYVQCMWLWTKSLIYLYESLVNFLYKTVRNSMRYDINQTTINWNNVVVTDRTWPLFSLASILQNKVCFKLTISLKRSASLRPFSSFTFNMTSYFHCQLMPLF